MSGRVDLRSGGGPGRAGPGRAGQGGVERFSVERIARCRRRMLLSDAALGAYSCALHAMALCRAGCMNSTPALTLLAGSCCALAADECEAGRALRSHTSR